MNQIEINNRSQNNLVIFGLPQPELLFFGKKQENEWKDQLFRVMGAAGLAKDDYKFDQNVQFVGVHDPEIPFNLAEKQYQRARKFLSSSRRSNGHTIIFEDLIEIEKPGGLRTLDDWHQDVFSRIKTPQDNYGLVMLTGSITMSSVVGCNADEVMKKAGIGKVQHHGTSYAKYSGLIGSFLGVDKSPNLTLVGNVRV